MKASFEPGQLLLYVNEQSGVVKFGILIGREPEGEDNWRTVWFIKGEGVLTYTHERWNVETWIRMRKAYFNEQ